jgi:GYF domain 2
MRRKERRGKSVSTWWYASDGERKGPVSDNDLHRLLISGTLTSSSLVWKEGMGGWQPAAQVEGLAPMLASLPPEVPTPQTAPQQTTTMAPSEGGGSRTKRYTWRKRITYAAIAVLGVGLAKVAGEVFEDITHPKIASSSAVLLASAPQEQADMLAAFVGHGCRGQAAFHMGTGNIRGTIDLWSVRCLDGREFAATIRPDGYSQGPLPCSELQARGLTCFMKVGSVLAAPDGSIVKDFFDRPEPH